MPTEGILVTGEATGSSRHNLSFRLRTRHPIIASIVFSVGAPDDAAKFAVLNGLLSNLDPAFPEDLRLLNEITRRRELVGTFSEHSMRRALYDRIAAILPGNGYVFQHRSIIEREMGNAEEAIRFARMALKVEPKHPHFQNTLGLALELAARSEDGLKRQSLLAEADRLFEEGIKRDRANPYSYMGKLNIIKQDIERSKNKDQKEELGIAALALLEDAYEATHESSMIAGELGKIKEQLGSLDKALDIVRRAEKKNPADMRLKQLLIKFSVENGDTKEALKVALEAAKADPTSWRTQRSIAQLLRNQNGNINAVRGHYEAAIRHHKGDISIVVELGAYLFTKGAFDDANKVFGSLKDLPMSAQERNQMRDLWRDPNGKPLVFEGKVKRIAGARGTVVAIPDNFEASFWRSTGTSLLREGNDVQFSVGFSSQGAFARNLRQVR